MIQRFITDGKLNVGYFLNKKDLGKCEMELFQTSANDLSLAMDGKFDLFLGFRQNFCLNIFRNKESRKMLKLFQPSATVGKFTYFTTKTLTNDENCLVIFRKKKDRRKCSQTGGKFWPYKDQLMFQRRKCSLTDGKYLY